MAAPDATHAEGVRRLYDLMRRVNSPSDLGEVLQEVANAVVEGLGYGVAAISRLDGDTLVMVAVAAPEEVRSQILGRRTPLEWTFAEFSHADHWGILRYVPHSRDVPAELYESMWVPDIVPDDEPDSWHPLDALYAPLYSADGALLGMMSVDLPPGNRVPDQQQRELLEMFVVQAGLAISNAQQRENLAEQVRLGQALKEVALAAALGDLDEVLAAAAAAIHRGMPAAQVSLRCFPDTVDNRREHAAGFPGVNPPAGPVPALRGDLVARAAHHGTAPIVVHADGRGCELTNSCEQLSAHLLHHGWERMAVAPVGVGVEVLGYLGVMRVAGQPDFNEAELDAIHEAGRELGRLVLEARVRETERRLVAELQEVDRYKGELIATISHELRTPLTSIVGHAELLEESDAHARSVSAITRNAARLQRLVDSLLDFARIQDRREHQRSPVDLAEACRATVEMLAIQAESAGVDLRLHGDRDKVLVAGDPEELGRVVDNICGNAVKYTRRGGAVDVAVRCVDGFGEVAVRDTGLGISPADQARLFSAFHRSTNPEALTIPGTGLGLAIARRIAEVHGGTIEVDSVLGEGSTFTLRVPLGG